MYGMKRDPSQDLDLLGLETPFAETFDSVDTFGVRAAAGESPFAEHAEDQLDESGEEALDWLDVEADEGEAGDDEALWAEDPFGAESGEGFDDVAFEDESAQPPRAKRFLTGSLWGYRSRAAGTEVVLYLPDAAKGQTSIELLFYAHGLIFAKKDGAWKGVCGGRESLAGSLVTGPPYNLGKIVAESGRPMALVLPRFQEPGQNWTTHGLDRPDRLNAFLAEAMAEISRAAGDSRPALSRLVIAGHSRAYGILYGLAGAHSSPDYGRGALAGLSHVWALDATYNFGRNPFRMKDFEALAAAKPGLGISFVYIKGSPTDRFGSASPSAVIELRPVAPGRNGHCLVPSKCLPVLLAGLGGAGQPSREYAEFADTDEFLPRIGSVPVRAKPQRPPAFTPCQQRIIDLVDQSGLARKVWPDQKVGVPHASYLNGMALTFARVHCKLRKSDYFALLMAKAPVPPVAPPAVQTPKKKGAKPDEPVDVLNRLKQKFDDAGMPNTVDGAGTLRHLFVLLVGLGLRESNGQYFQGPHNPEHPQEQWTTAEAGLFQMSHSIGVGNAEDFADLHHLYKYLRTLPYNGYLRVFARGMRAGNNKVNDPAKTAAGRFRNFCLTQPALAAELAALALRSRNHWGPIEFATSPFYLSPECDRLFRDIQNLVDADEKGNCTCFLPEKWTPASAPPLPPKKPASKGAGSAAKSEGEFGFDGEAETVGWGEDRWEADDEQWVEGEQFDEARDERFDEWAEFDQEAESADDFGLDEEEGEFGEEEAADDVTGEFGYFEEEWQPTGPEPLAVPSTAPIAFAALPPEGSFWPIRTKVAQRKVVSFPYKDRNRLLYVGRPGRTFLANRKTKKKEPRWHIGVDLFAKRGDIVVACEAGTIVAFSHFYTASTGQDTYRLLIHHPASGVVVNYGEVTKDSLPRNKLKVGSEVQAGQEIGFVSDTDMIHFEAWAPAESPKDYAKIPRWMKKDKKPPARLLNPTRYLLFLRENGIDP